MDTMKLNSLISELKECVNSLEEAAGGMSDESSSEGSSFGEVEPDLDEEEGINNSRQKRKAMF